MCEALPATSTSVRIRPAAPQDVQTLGEIESVCFQHDVWAADDFLRYKSLVAEVDHAVVGFVVTRDVFCQTSAESAEREILNLAVMPLHRGLGIAQSLLQSATKSVGIYLLEVRESNLAAIAIYAKLGFREIGRRQDYYQSPRENAIVMRLERC